MPDDPAVATAAPVLSPTVDPQSPPAPDPTLSAAPPVTEPASQQGERAPDTGDPTDADPTATPPEPTAWAALPPEEVLAHEDFAPLLEHRAAEAQARGKAETYAQMQPFMRRQTDSAEKQFKAVEGINSTLKQAQKDGTLTPDQVKEILDDNEGALSALRGDQDVRGYWRGINSLVGALAKAGEAPTLVQDFGNRIWEYSTADQEHGDPDPQLLPDLFKAFTKAATEPLKVKLAESEAHVKRLEAEATQTKTNSQPAPTTVAGAGGGGTKPFKDMSSDEQGEHLTAPDRDADTARFIAANS
ncbi:hypothetical protein LCGC14_0511340 [marine sediment metagenome]|uniref:Uncharacterized protein n=1 Tax=marine sediment metagenome TaxID=412755 RepID=A0A0F9V9K7_9ZZZZ